MAAATLYLAGFDVFRPDARAWGDQLKALCAAHGFVGLYPLDHQVPADLQGPAAAQWIYHANVALIQRADAVLANLNNFRGLEPDSGTAFEVGLATALGKPVWAYLDDTRNLREQLPCSPGPNGTWVDEQGMVVEDFGLPRNLMLACAARIVPGDADQALRALAREWGLNPPSGARCGTSASTGSGR
jgi:nucleoside 2-deoxyribosyltransferase